MALLLLRTPFLSQLTLPHRRSGAYPRTRAAVGVGTSGDPVASIRYDEDQPQPCLNRSGITLESREARIAVLGLETRDSRLPNSHTSGDSALR